MSWKPPEEVRFGINAKWISYMHDMNLCKRGLPGDVWFKTGEITSNGRVVLTAPGYGGKPYGDGAIYVNWIDVAIWGRGREAA
jgi:hypothetical protein